MALYLDHLVHFVKDPAESARSFAKLGWTTIQGGKHTKWGTYNTLAYFDLTYIEWLGVYDKQLAKENELGRQAVHNLEINEGIGRFALRTDDIDPLAAAWRENGLPHVGPFPGERTRPDGTVIRWKLMFPLSTEKCQGLPIPFVIEWGDNDNLRTRDLIAEGAIQESGMNEWKLAAIHCCLDNPAVISELWLKYFPEFVVETPNPGNLQTFVLKLPNVNIVFHSPVEETKFGNEFSGAYRIDLVRRESNEDDGRSHANRSALLHGLEVRQS